jgi:hypothetical protein
MDLFSAVYAPRKLSLSIELSVTASKEDMTEPEDIYLECDEFCLKHKLYTERNS